ncbi:MAG: exodeoxyribonuclease VII large subunit [Burkholderiales bacterium]|nr:exodeoxyribonuclease VII large subunit [Burkholderiales bacterium]
MSEFENPTGTPRIWQVGALCRAIADALESRFNPVAVRGEISGFNRAPSGHCYFALKDESGQIRCAMFRRAAGLLDFAPRDGELVEVRGRLGVYEPRGDLQLIVESMSRAGQGALFEQFLKLKARLEAEGLFDAARKRELPARPRGIGLVTSLGAAALHDVVTALQRRVPHIPVFLAPASVQGAAAPAELVAALQQLYALVEQGSPALDVILLVRGGGSMEDLWAFNDERLARTLAQSPVPVVSGVGHETDFTIADFVADLRSPTPTAAAELVAEARSVGLGALDQLQGRLQETLQWLLDRHSQRLDLAAGRLGRPSGLVARQQQSLSAQAQRLRYATTHVLSQRQRELQQWRKAWPQSVQRGLQTQQLQLERASLRLQLLDPSLVLQRGYAWVSNERHEAVTRARDLAPGQALHLHFAQGRADVSVTAVQEKE